MSEFDKLLNIFKSSESNTKISKTQKKVNNNKRKSLSKSNGRGGNALDVKRSRSNLDLVQSPRRDIFDERSTIIKKISDSLLFQDDEIEIVDADKSTDKDEIIPHLSCIVSDFDTTTTADKNPAITRESDKNHTKIDRKLCNNSNLFGLINPNDFSPNIEDCSQLDYVKSQETMRVRDINNQLETQIQKNLQKLKLPSNCGTLTKKFLQARLKKLEEWLMFLNSQKNEEEKSMKIQIIHFKTEFGNLIVQFKFLVSDEPNRDNNVSLCFTLPLIFEKCLEKHKIFRVVFYSKEPTLVEPNRIHYYSLKFIKAIRSE